MRLIPVIAILATLAMTVGPAPVAAAEAEDEPGLVVTVEDDGTVRAAGRLPESVPVKALRRRFAQIDRSGGVTSAGPGDAEAWERLFDALDIVLARLRGGKVRVSGTRFELAGELRPGFSAETTGAALRLALGAAWEVEIDLAEAPPPAEVKLKKTAAGVEVSGILPAGIEPAQALRLMDAASGDAMTGGGGGDPAAWRSALVAIGPLLSVFADAEGLVADGVVELSGALKPGYEAQRLVAWLQGRLDEDWEVHLTAEETPATEGAVRRDLATGRTERLRRGHWVAEYDFAPDSGRCGSESGRLLAGGGIGFVTGKATFNRSAARLLDRLAGLAIRCLNRGGLRLEIGGHTDNVGNDAKNMALSTRRAMAVLLALIDRGVKADAMTAVGYGETMPVADNATAEGRARNRRISFRWSG
jgi:OOP family OmpA-OmpF porin